MRIKPKPKRVIARETAAAIEAYAGPIKHCPTVAVEATTAQIVAEDRTSLWQHFTELEIWRRANRKWGGERRW